VLKICIYVTKKIHYEYMKLVDIFKRLGYPKHSDVVYDVLSKSEVPLSVSDVAKQARVSRVVVYRCIEKMEADELITPVSVGKRTYYQANSAYKLTEAIRTMEEQTEDVVEKYMTLRQKEAPQNIRFLYGASGIRAAFDDVIEHSKKGETFFRYTSEQDLAKVNSYLARDYRIRRDKKKLERMVISNTVSGSQKKSRLERFIRYIPAAVDQFEQNIIQLVYGTRVAIIDLTKEEVTIIENQQLADFQKTIFKVLYKQLPR